MGSEMCIRDRSVVNNDIHDYLALFLKGKADGEPREEGRKFNSVICLDTSGSMRCPLNNENKEQTRLSLSI